MKNLENKVKVILTLVLVGLLVVPLAVGVNRILSSSSDNISTFIRCSNGNIYTASFSNLQTAISSLNGIGGEIILPVCNLTATTTLTITNNITLRGMGKNSTIIFLAAGSDCDMVNIISSSHVKILDMCFDMNNHSQNEKANISLIDITGATGAYSNNITIRDCMFKNGCVKSMIDCQEYVSDITIENCVFDKRTWYNGTNWGFGVAIWISENNAIIKNNFIRDTWAAGIYIEHATPGGTQIQSKRVIIEGNIITGVIGIGIGMEGPTAASGYVAKAGSTTISNNVIYDLHDCTAYNTPAMSCGIQATSNTTVTGNVLVNTGHGVQTSTTGDGSVTITGNTFRDLDDYAIESVSDNVIVTDNVFSNCDGFSVIYSSKNIMVSNNKLYSSTGYGIYVKTSSTNSSLKDGIVITGNIVEGMDSVGIYVDDISAITKYVIISNNFVTSVGNDGIHMEDSDNGSIIGNVVVDSTLSNQGIDLIDASNVTIIGNRVLGFSEGISEGGNSNYNIIVGNDCKGNTAQIDKNGANTVAEHNQGTVS